MFAVQVMERDGQWRNEEMFSCSTKAFNAIGRLRSARCALFHRVKEISQKTSGVVWYIE